MNLINDLLNLTGDEIYQKYGYKRDETITHTAKFPNGIEADIKLVSNLRRRSSIYRRRIIP